MGLTPTYQLPYPEATDPADVPVDLRELAERVEAIFSELAYAQFTAQLQVTATTEAAAATVVTAPAVSFDGRPVLVEFYAQSVVSPSAGAANTQLWLFMDGVSQGILGTVLTPAGAVLAVPVRVARRLSPAAGSHTFSVRATVSTGTGIVNAGPGGAGQQSPGYIRITRV